MGFGEGICTLFNPSFLLSDYNVTARRSQQAITRRLSTIKVYLKLILHYYHWTGLGNSILLRKMMVRRVPNARNLILKNYLQLQTKQHPTQLKNAPKLKTKTIFHPQNYHHLHLQALSLKPHLPLSLSIPPLPMRHPKSRNHTPNLPLHLPTPPKNPLMNPLTPMNFLPLPISTTAPRTSLHISTNKTICLIFTCPILMYIVTRRGRASNGARIGIGVG